MEITQFYLGPNLQEGYVIGKYAKAIFIDAVRLKTRQIKQWFFHSQIPCLYLLFYHY
jgi:hypothetical protein